MDELRREYEKINKKMSFEDFLEEIELYKENNQAKGLNEVAVAKEVVYDINHNILGNCKCGKLLRFFNIGRSHFDYCERCKTVSYVGGNLFSGWRDESEDIWMENLKEFKDFTIVKSNQFNPTGKKLRTLGEYYGYPNKLNLR